MVWAQRRQAVGVPPSIGIIEATSGMALAAVRLILDVPSHLVFVTMRDFLVTLYSGAACPVVRADTLEVSLSRASTSTACCFILHVSVTFIWCRTLCYASNNGTLQYGVEYDPQSFVRRHTRGQHVSHTSYVHADMLVPSLTGCATIGVHSRVEFCLV